jgi:hypothetical protein
MAPRLIESCFQVAGIWEMGSTGKMGLPLHIDRVTTLRDPESAGGRRLFAVARPAGGGFDAEVVDADGAVYVRLSGYKTVALPTAVDDERLRPLRDAMR